MLLWTGLLFCCKGQPQLAALIGRGGGGELKETRLALIRQRPGFYLTK